MNAESIASASKANLRSSLMVTHNLTVASPNAADFVINKMNEVLKAVVGSNWSHESLGAVGALYTAIGEAQPQMVDHAQNLALVNFSRSFAVTMEDAIRDRAGAGGGDRNNNNNTTSAGGGWTQFSNNNNAPWSASNDSCNGGSGGQARDSWQVPAAGGSSDWGGHVPAHLRGNQVVPSPLQGFGTPAATQQFNNGFGSTAPASAARPVLSPEQQAAARAARAARDAKKDYSPEAREGRITVFKIPLSITEPQLRAHFVQIGVPTELSYPQEKGKHKGFALLKFKDNETADAACAHLDGKLLGGAPLQVARAAYWFKSGNAAEKDANVAPPAFGTGPKALADASAPAARRIAPSASSEDVQDEQDEQSTEDEGSDPGIE